MTDTAGVGRRRTLPARPFLFICNNADNSVILIDHPQFAGSLEYALVYELIQPSRDDNPVDEDCPSLFTVGTARRDVETKTK